MSSSFIYPDWPAPDNVRAVMTTRHGGSSVLPFDSLNLGDHVDDNPLHVNMNREQVATDLGLLKSPAWLTQVHGVEVAKASTAISGDKADAIIGNERYDVCAIMTADCLPVLFCNKQGSVIAAAHAGWRGLASGVLEATISKMACDPNDILVWMGAAIGPAQFEVGGEVKDAFMSQYLESANAFKERSTTKWLADIYHLARIRLSHAQIPAENVFGGELCTYTQNTDFYSYRRESRTGRMASLIWLT